MNVTQKLRRSLLLFLPALLFTSMVMAVLSSGNVFAAEVTSGSFIADEVKDRVEKKNKYMFLRYCFDRSPPKLELSTSDVNGWDFFEDKDGKFGDQQTVYAIVGNYYGPGKDATEDCEDGNSVGDAFEVLGFTDSRRTFCALDGAVLVKQNTLRDDKYGDDEECYSKEVSGGHHWSIDHDDAGRLRKSFEKLVEEAKTDVEGSGVNAWVTGGLQPHEEYVRYYRSFVEQCGVGGDDIEIEPGTYAAGDADADNKYMLTVVTQEGEEVNYLATGQVSSGSQVAIQAELGGSQYKLGDGENASNMNNDRWPRGKVVTCNTAVGDAAGLRKFSKAYADWLKENPQASGNNIVGDGAGKAEGSIGADCAGFGVKEILSLNWMLCPLIQGAMSTANALEGQIAGMLCINETDIFAGADMTCDGEPGKASTQKAFHNAWNVFRGLALGLLAIAGLLMIISQGLGFEIFDAYTIKKTLPRILVAAILISLSWPLLEAVVTFSNALGIGIRSLIYQPFIQSGIDTVVLNGGEAAVAAVLGVGGTVAAFALLGTIGMLSFVATALLALLIAFFVLVIRNILVILLVIIAPIAIAMYILPNTEKWAKTWWDWLFKALLAFPIITAMIAIGHVFAAVTSQKDGGLLTTIVAFIAYFAPYFLIPAAFRLAGGAIATIGGFANDRSRGGFDRLKKFRGDTREKNAHAMKEGNRFRNNNALARRFNATTHAAALAPSAGLNPATMRSRYTAAMSQHSFDQAEEIRTKNADFLSGAQDDRLLRVAGAAQGRADIQRRLRAEGISGAELDTSTGIVERMQSSGSRHAVQQAVAMQRFATGTGYNDANGEFDYQAAMDTIKDASHGDRALAGRLLGQAKGVSAQAGQLGFGGAAYGTLSNGLDQSFANQAVDGDRIALDAWESNDAVSVSRARDPHVRAMTRAVSNRINAIHAGAAPRDAGELGRLSAQLESFKDTTGMYAAPQRSAIVNAEVRVSERSRQDVHGEVWVHGQDPNSQVYDINTRQPVAPPTPDVDQYRRNRSSRGGDPNDPRLPEA